MSEQIDRIVLWRHPEHEHARWMRMRMGDRTYADLVRKQDGIITGAQADGIEAVIVAASVDEMLDACKRLGVEPDQQGRSLAIIAIDAHREGITDEVKRQFPWDANGVCVITARVCDLADKSAWPRLGFQDRDEALDSLENLAQEMLERIQLREAAVYLEALDNMRATGSSNHARPCLRRASNGHTDQIDEESPSRRDESRQCSPSSEKHQPAQAAIDS